MPAHGITFHYFHDEPAGGAQPRHPPGQGSLSAAELAELLRCLGPERILPARQWLARALAGRLRPDDLCLTFDDNLRCQYDVALPVLAEFGLTAFWFVPTCVLEGRPQRVELYRAFRVRCFADVDDFYAAFFRALATSDYANLAAEALRDFHPSGYLREFAFYSEADRRFRFVRDQVLGPQRDQQLMDMLIRLFGLEPDELARDLWMDADCLRELHAAGHVIGLHSHNHPTRLAALDAVAQLREYRDNHEHLARLLGEPPIAMSHPCNSYTRQTLAILEELGIRVGFRANLALVEHGPLEYPRADQADLVRKVQPCASRCSPATNPVISG